jgi:LEA14-like dessication related protein
MVRSAALLLALGIALGTGLGGCHPAGSPELRVLGVHEEPRHDVVFVQVSNPASHAMRLTKLEYTFAAAGATVSAGEVALARDIPAGAAVVVEIPLDNPSEKPLTLSGKLTAELNQIVQIFSVSAQIQPAK